MPSATVAPLTGQDSVLDELHEMPPRSWTKTARTWLACISHARVCHWRKIIASLLITHIYEGLIHFSWCEPTLRCIP